MEIKKGKVNNINKRILIGTITLALVNGSFVGCSSVQSFQYSTNEQGEIVTEGTTDYNYLKECYFIVVENPDYEMTEFYIASKVQRYYSHLPVSDTYYYSVLNGKEVYSTVDNAESNRTLKFETKLDDYLFSMNEIKSTYTKEDVEIILDQMEKNYIKENDKELVKE